jgi:DNA-binding transcriptional ArsR family regulator
MDADRVLSALGDDGCRIIIAETGEEALSANELSERCELPLSTTYRKLEILTDVGLLEERVRIRQSGAHLSEYVCVVEDLCVSVGGTDARGLTVSTDERPDATPAGSRGRAD